MLTVNVFGMFSHWSLSLNVLYMTNFLSVDYIFDDLLVNSVPDPHLEIRGGGGGGGLLHPGGGGGGGVVIQPRGGRRGRRPINFFRPFGPQFGLKIRCGPGLPRPLPWIRHCN